MSDSIPGPEGDGLAFGWGAGDVARIRAAVRRVEASYRNPPPRRRLYPAGGGGGHGLIPADSGSGFAAGSRATPSSATVTLLVQSGLGWTTVGGSTRTALNTFTAAIGASKTIWLQQIGLNYYVIQVDC